MLVPLVDSYLWDIRDKVIHAMAEKFTVWKHLRKYICMYKQFYKDFDSLDQLPSLRETKKQNNGTNKLLLNINYPKTNTDAWTPLERCHISIALTDDLLPFHWQLIASGKPQQMVQLQTSTLMRHKLFENQVCHVTVSFPGKYGFDRMCYMSRSFQLRNVFHLNFPVGRYIKCVQLFIE